MNLIKVKVTKDHIERGEKETDDRCPVALAISELDPNATVSVCDDDIWFGYPPEYGEYPTPEKVRRFIKHFDAGLPVRPFTFELAARSTEGGS